MLGPKNYPTPLQQVNHDTDLGKHHRKLEEIHKSTKNREFLDQHVSDKEKLFEARERGLKFHNSERLVAIEKDNELLLGKLVEIARKKKTAADFKADKHNIGSLNAPSRKREKDRIAAENEAFARRLLSQQPSFNRKKLETDYEKHNSRVKQMQKVPFFSPRKTKLPPLKEEEIRQSKSTHNLKVTKNVQNKNYNKSVKNIDSKNEVNSSENEKITKEEDELKTQQEKEELERVEKELKEAREAREAKEAREAQEAKEVQEAKEAQERAEKAQKEKEEQERQEKERIEAEEKQKQEQQQKSEVNVSSPQEKSATDVQKSQTEIKNEPAEEKKSADKIPEQKEENNGIAETKKPE